MENLKSAHKRACFCIGDCNKTASELHSLISSIENNCQLHNLTYVGGIVLNDSLVSNEIKLCTLLSMLSDDIDGVNIIYTLNPQCFAPCFNMYTLFSYAICYGNDIELKYLETGESQTLRDAALACAPEDGKDELNRFIATNEKCIASKKDIQISSVGVKKLLDEIFRVTKTGFVFIKLNDDIVEFTADELWFVANNYCSEKINVDLLGLAIVQNNNVSEADIDRAVRAIEEQSAEVIIVAEFLKDPFSDGADIEQHSEFKTVDVSKLKSRFPHKELLRRVVNKIAIADVECINV